MLDPSPGSQSPATPSPCASAPLRSPSPDRLRCLLDVEGGFTLEHRTARSVVVGVAVCVDPTRTLRFRADAWSERRVRRWVRQSAAFIDRTGSRDVYLGGWRSSEHGWIYLDVVRVIHPDGLTLARSLGRFHGQQALFDLAEQLVVPVAI